MPPYKPMKRRDYERWIRQFGWSLIKSGTDWTLRNHFETPVCTIIITHPGGEIPPPYVHRTYKHLKEKGFNP